MVMIQTEAIEWLKKNTNYFGDCTRRAVSRDAIINNNSTVCFCLLGSSPLIHSQYLARIRAIRITVFTRNNDRCRVTRGIFSYSWLDESSELRCISYWNFRSFITAVHRPTFVAPRNLDFSFHPVYEYTRILIARPTLSSLTFLFIFGIPRGFAITDLHSLTFSWFMNLFD